MQKTQLYIKSKIASSIGNVSISSGLGAMAGTGFTAASIQNWKPGCKQRVQKNTPFHEPMIRQSSMWSGHAFRFLPLGSCRYSVLTTPPWAFDFPFGHPPGESEYTKGTWGHFACTYNRYIYIYIYVYMCIYICICVYKYKSIYLSSYLIIYLSMHIYIVWKVLRFQCMVPFGIVGTRWLRSGHSSGTNVEVHLVEHHAPRLLLCRRFSFQWSAMEAIYPWCRSLSSRLDLNNPTFA